MTKPLNNSDSSKSKGLVFLEYALLIICICVIALRSMFTESPGPQSVNHSVSIGETIYSLSMSAVLILSFASWFIWSFCSRRFLYRFTAMEVGLCLFTLAAVVAGFIASNKRAAIADFVVLIAPLLMAVLLVQILDSYSKIKLLLICIAALGVVSTWQCAEQFFVGNDVMIEQYEQAPQTILEPLGIRPGTFAHMLFEHRLYSRGVRGFFTTANSAGSFALLASFAAIALFIDRFKNRKSDSRRLITCGIIVVVVFLGLAVTRSKGAITASLIAFVMFVAYLLFGNWLKTHRKAVLVVCLLFVIAGGCVVIWYGLAHDRLPGGNSMLVRWQYWDASVRMYADHPITGVGPGNFADFYPHYKPDSAIEAVADPHNFLLTILTQYGPLGLIGFLAIVLVPLWKVAFSGSPLLSPKKHNTESAFGALAVICLIVVSVALLVVRPVVMPPVVADAAFSVMLYVVSTLYIVPVVIFAIGFSLLAAPLRATCNLQPATRNLNIVAALFCAVIGLLIHNLIDFAIFEPGVFTLFCALTACLIAMDCHRKSRPQLVFKPALFVRVLIVAGVLLIVFACFNYAFAPVAKSAAKIAHARQAGFNGQFGKVHNLLTAAADDDSLSPAALSLNGRFYLQEFYTAPSVRADLLLQAKECLLAATGRNNAGFKNFERLTGVYTLLAKAQPQNKTDWLNSAFDSASSTVERYPGCGRVRIKLAKIAEQLGKTDIAIKHYRKAVDIEDAYQRQFRIMYPARQMFSRLGQDKYDFALERLKKLSNPDSSF